MGFARATDVMRATLETPESRDQPVVRSPAWKGMPMTRRQYWRASVVVLISLTSLQVAVAIQAQPLAEVARLARSARSQTTGPVRTFTQADLPASALLEARQPDALTNWYRMLAEAALERERVLERRLREALAPAPPPRMVAHGDAERAPRQDLPSSGLSTGGGIPLAWVYGTTAGPPLYLGQPIRRAWSEHGGETGGRARGVGARGSHAPSADNATPERGSMAPRPEPARNGYAESSRPMQYVAPGILVPRVQPLSRPLGR